ncbi:hypothetical protein DFH08DRAFT_822777 [Mycena albidolilacea]|uniref:Uncharacterized protein n=1 Tax=Mycena albidolilacea TaxID=1033008 RepID=A0AAD6Z8C4_9AGAR|nr:hypothetical protein DFH08DRAFT_822777 [Mycena albidolilacea]
MSSSESSNRSKCARKPARKLRVDSDEEEVGEGKRAIEIECRIGLIENNVCWCGDCVGGSEENSRLSTPWLEEYVTKVGNLVSYKGHFAGLDNPPALIDDLHDIGLYFEA